ncbi:MAG: MATE family efflux transporter, partial [Muribaculaceae bacterium]|nr:MATE family efflux transporter [Muribaculaceae bacterium]
MNRDNLNLQILKLAAPAILNNITVPLLGLCDTAIAGHLGSASYLGAISVGAMMLNVFFWLAGFLRMGTTGLTARSIGRKSVSECSEVLNKSLIIAAVISIMVILFQTPLLKLFLYLIAPESNVEELASLYFRIGVWGVPAQLAVMAVSGWFIGLQTTVVPMTIAIGTNVINIITSITLAFGLKKGFSGIAYGTLCANWIGAIAALVWARKRYLSLAQAETTISPEASIPSKGAIKWRELFSVNGALFIRSACIMAVTLTVTSVGARMGEITLAANAVIMQFFMFFSYFMDGFAFSGEALAGKFSGAGEGGMVSKVLRRLCLWGGGMAFTFFLIYAFGSKGIISLLTDSSEVIKRAMDYKIWIMLLPPITVAAFIYDGIFVGLTRTKAMMAVTLAGAALFFILLFGVNLPIDNNLLWLSFESYLLIRGGALALICRFNNEVQKRCCSSLILRGKAPRPG